VVFIILLQLFFALPEVQLQLPTPTFALPEVQLQLPTFCTSGSATPTSNFLHFRLRLLTLAPASCSPYNIFGPGLLPIFTYTYYRACSPIAATPHCLWSPLPWQYSTSEQKIYTPWILRARGAHCMYSA
jgi:hypothetical protein